MTEKLISAKWALNETFHNRMAELAIRRISAGKAPFAIKIEERKPPTMASVSGYEYLDRASVKSGKVVIVPVIGTMTRYGDLCSWGTEDIGNWIMEANNDPSISAIVLEINSPGGEVDGTELLGAIVKNSPKPVVAWVAGMAASAAYWVASQAREIMAESATISEVGSIGVLAMHVDASAYYEKEGFKVQIIRSDGSEDKALFNSIEPLSDTALTELKASLNIVRKTFIDTVKSGRPKVSEDVFSGKMFDGKTAKEKGMVDRFGFLGDAIQRADLLARKAN